MLCVFSCVLTQQVKYRDKERGCSDKKKKTMSILFSVLCACNGFLVRERANTRYVYTYMCIGLYVKQFHVRGCHKWICLFIYGRNRVVWSVWRLLPYCWSKQPNFYRSSYVNAPQQYATIHCRGGLVYRYLFHKLTHTKQETK